MRVIWLLLLHFINVLAQKRDLVLLVDGSNRDIPSKGGTFFINGQRVNLVPLRGVPPGSRAHLLHKGRVVANGQSIQFRRSQGLRLSNALQRKGPALTDLLSRRSGVTLTTPFNSHGSTAISEEPSANLIVQTLFLDTHETKPSSGIEFTAPSRPGFSGRKPLPSPDSNSLPPDESMRPSKHRAPAPAPEVGLPPISVPLMPTLFAGDGGMDLSKFFDGMGGSSDDVTNSEDGQGSSQQSDNKFSWEVDQDVPQEKQNIHKSWGVGNSSTYSPGIGIGISDSLPSVENSYEMNGGLNPGYTYPEPLEPPKTHVNTNKPTTYDVQEITEHTDGESASAESVPWQGPGISFEQSISSEFTSPEVPVASSETYESNEKWRREQQRITIIKLTQENQHTTDELRMEKRALEQRIQQLLEEKLMREQSEKEQKVPIIEIPDAQKQDSQREKLEEKIRKIEAEKDQQIQLHQKQLRVREWQLKQLAMKLIKETARDESESLETPPKHSTGSKKTVSPPSKPIPKVPIYDKPEKPEKYYLPPPPPPPPTLASPKKSYSKAPPSPPPPTPTPTPLPPPPSPPPRPTPEPSHLVYAPKIVQNPVYAPMEFLEPLYNYGGYYGFPIIPWFSTPFYATPDPVFYVPEAAAPPAPVKAPAPPPKPTNPYIPPPEATYSYTYLPKSPIKANTKPVQQTLQLAKAPEPTLNQLWSLNDPFPLLPNPTLQALAAHVHNNRNSGVRNVAGFPAPATVVQVSSLQEAASIVPWANNVNDLEGIIIDRLPQGIPGFILPETQLVEQEPHPADPLLSVHDCEDKHKHCPYWAVKRQCSGVHQGYMEDMCPMSCGRCSNTIPHFRDDESFKKTKMS